MAERPKQSDQDLLDELSQPLPLRAYRFLKDNKTALIIAAGLAIGGRPCGTKLAEQWKESNAIADRESAYERADKIAKEARKGAIPPPNSATNFSGVKVEFLCVPVPTAVAFPNDSDAQWDQNSYVWAPMEADRFFTLEDLTQKIGVEYSPAESKKMSEAKAGIGTRVTEVPQELVNAFKSQIPFESLKSEGAETPGVVAHSMSIIPDRYALSTGVIIFGHVDTNGRPVQYYLEKGKGKLACDGVVKGAPDFIPEPQMVTASLQHKGPEFTLKDFVKDLPEANEYYKSEFDEFGLGDWYETNYEPLIQLLDAGVRDASLKYAKRSQLKSLVKYFTERAYERNLLRLLKFMDENLGEEALELFVESIKRKRFPAIRAADKDILNQLDALGIARAGMISIRPGMEAGQTEKTVTHELMHSVVQGWKITNSEIPEEEVMIAGDFFWIEGVTEMLTQFAHGNMDLTRESYENNREAMSYRSRVELVLLLARLGYMQELIAHYTYSPTLSLDDYQKEAIAGWEYEVPNEYSQEHMYALMFKACGIEKASDMSNRTRRNAVKSIIQSLDAMRHLENIPKNHEALDGYAGRIKEKLESCQ